MNLILGSTSPRRVTILNHFSYPFTQVAPLFDESRVPYSGDPAAYVTTVALEKAHSLTSLYPNACILTADTMVALQGAVLGKPKDREHAVQMLSSLSNNWHSVFTGVAIITPDKTIADVEETKVLFNDLSPYEIEKYLERIQFKDKAGSYAIEEAAGLIIKEIRGCFYNVLGLPINTLQKLLQQVGINLWDHIR